MRAGIEGIISLVEKVGVAALCRSDWLSRQHPWGWHRHSNTRSGLHALRFFLPSAKFLQKSDQCFAARPPVRIKLDPATLSMLLILFLQFDEYQLAKYNKALKGPRVIVLELYTY